MSSTPVSAQGQARFTPRMLINVGVFTAIYFVIMFATGMLGLFSPFMEFVGFAIGMLINGTVIMLYLVRTRVFGALSLLGLIVGILMFLTGHYWATIPIAAVLGLVGDFLVASGHYRSRVRNIFAYAIFQLWIIGPLLPFFINTGYGAQIASSMGQQYADAMMALFTPLTIIIFLAIAFVISAIAAWIGTRILEKNLSRAGII